MAAAADGSKHKIKQPPQQQKINSLFRSFQGWSTTAFFLALVFLTALLLCAIFYTDPSQVSTSFLLRRISGAVSSTFTSPESQSPNSESEDDESPDEILTSQAQQDQSQEASVDAPSPAARTESGALSEASPARNRSASDEHCLLKNKNREEEERYSRGRWVYDERYPLYNSAACPFIDQGFRCTENGRPDRGYLKWRWEPYCAGNWSSFVRPQAVLEKLRGNRVVFVGDSIGRNQWESFICLLAGGVENKSRIYEENGEAISKHTGFLSFRFADFNCSVEYYRSPFLVPQTRPPKGAPPQVKSVLRVDTIDWTASKWLGAKIMVFNAGHWWNYEKTLRGGCYFAQSNKVNASMQVREAFEAAIKTWGKWIQRFVDTNKTQVFFRSYSSVHFRNGTWRNGGQCHQETEPVIANDDDGNVVTSSVEAWTTKVVRRAVRKLRKPVRVLDISRSTDLRKDGHPSLWYQGKGKGPAAKNRQDCSHWCLPGVPDTWNLLLLNLAQLL